MSSDYYGAIAGDIADTQAAEEAWLAWLNEFTKREDDCASFYEQLRAAFKAGAEWASAIPEAFVEGP